MSTTSTYATVRDVLDYFAKCPRCGYPAQAQTTVRRLPDGRVDAETIASCGLPCGWQGPARAGTVPSVDLD
ncbi:hypothetical protein [Nocardia farcinica]|uniref:hypothetical protein n=1 Tax=Nocardia farcinica TaxID=37329 RepID=UPI0037972E2A